jgi:Fe-S cluster assembly iron-binding protein IscA
MVDGSCQQSTKERALLTLTENASTIVKDITAQQGGSDTAGLRITSEDPAQGLLVTAAPEPQPGDQTVEADGDKVYLDVPASQALDDQILDAAVQACPALALSLQH